MNTFAAILLLAAQAAAPAATPREIDPKVAAQVPVIAGKLENWRGAWGTAGGKIACKTVRSSGDEEIDALGCASMIACVKPAYPALKTIADGKATVDEKKRRIAAKLATLQPCMKQHRGQGIAELALKRGRG
jgi:predicted outer membrane protein